MEERDKERGIEEPWKRGKGRGSLRLERRRRKEMMNKRIFSLGSKEKDNKGKEIELEEEK